MNNPNKRRSVVQSDKPASLHYRAKVMVKSKYAQIGGSISFTVSKGCAPVEKLSKQGMSARDSGIAKLKPRQHKRRQHCTTNAKSTRQLRRNERERGRKARLNAAFQVLRSVVPNSIPAAGSPERKMTQVEILRLAKNYISNLTEILQKNSESYSYKSYRFESH